MPNYRVVFYDGPMGNREKNVDIYAESFDDARKQAYQMPEARNRMYSDVMISEIPKGPSVIGLEFEFEMNNPPFYQKDRDYLFIRANNEAEALDYYNSHFKGERYNRDAGTSVPDGRRVRGRAIKTYYACTDRYCADATLKGQECSLNDKIEEARVQSSSASKQMVKSELQRSER